jgi:hypothetical protein
MASQDESAFLSLILKKTFPKIALSLCGCQNNFAICLVAVCKGTLDIVLGLERSFLSARKLDSVARHSSTLTSGHMCLLSTENMANSKLRSHIKCT